MTARWSWNSHSWQRRWSSSLSISLSKNVIRCHRLLCTNIKYGFHSRAMCDYEKVCSIQRLLYMIKAYLLDLRFDSTLELWSSSLCWFYWAHDNLRLITFPVPYKHQIRQACLLLHAGLDKESAKQTLLCMDLPDEVITPFFVFFWEAAQLCGHLWKPESSRQHG